MMESAMLGHDATFATENAPVTDTFTTANMSAEALLIAKTDMIEPSETSDISAARLAQTDLGGGEASVAGKIALEINGSSWAASGSPAPEIIELNLDDDDAEEGGPNHALVSEGRNERERVLLRLLYRLEHAVEQCMLAAESASVPIRDNNLRIGSDLVKTSVRVFEAIERAQRQGQQRVIVEHVSAERPGPGRARMANRVQTAAKSAPAKRA